MCDRSVRYRDGRGGADTGGVHEKHPSRTQDRGLSFFFGRSPTPSQKRNDSDVAYADAYPPMRRALTGHGDEDPTAMCDTTYLCKVSGRFVRLKLKVGAFFPCRRSSSS